MIDRLTTEYVVDFFYFVLINFPLFNVADICVTVAVFLVVIYMLFIDGRKEKKAGKAADND